MAYYDGEILTPADSEMGDSRDLGLLIPPKVLDDLYMKDESDWWVGVTSGEVRVEIQDTSGYSKLGATMVRDAFSHEQSSSNRWERDMTKGDEEFVYRGNSIRPGRSIIDTLGINSPELNNVRWTVDTGNWRCVLTKVVK